LIRFHKCLIRPFLILIYINFFVLLLIDVIYLKRAQFPERPFRVEDILNKSVKDYFSSHRICAHNRNCDWTTSRVCRWMQPIYWGIKSKKTQTTTVIPSPLRGFQPMNHKVVEGTTSPCETKCVYWIQLNAVHTNWVTPQVHLPSFFDAHGHSDSLCKK